MEIKDFRVLEHTQEAVLDNTVANHVKDGWVAVGANVKGYSTYKRFVYKLEA